MYKKTDLHMKTVFKEKGLYPLSFKIIMFLLFFNGARHVKTGEAVIHLQKTCISIISY
jgi:hypothetical protein